MTWFWITIIAYALNAVSLLIDKFLLDKKLPNPAVYTLAICLLGVLSLVLLPFGWKTPTATEVLVAIISGVLFAGALYLMFEALKKGESSRIITFLGGVQPIIILPLAWLFLGETFVASFWLAFFFLVAGTILISLESGRANAKAYAIAFASAALFALSLVLAKYAYLSMDNFITPFVFTRLGSAIAVLPLLLLPSVIIGLQGVSTQEKAGSIGKLLVLGQASGALSSVMVNFAVAISVNATAIINAMQGLQYVFLLAGVIVLTKFFPKVLKEKMSPRILIQKVAATALIIVGLVIISF